MAVKVINYDSPCWGHNCEKYKDVEAFREAVLEICQDKQGEAIPYVFFLRELGIKKSTPRHWKECRPLNLKVLEDAKMYCDESIFKSIKSDPKLVWEYWKLTRLDDEKDIVETPTKEIFLDPDSFGEKEEFKE